MKIQKIIQKLGKYSKIILFFMDICTIAISYYIAQIFIENNIYELTNEHINSINFTILIAILIYQIFFHLFNLYRNITRFESGKDYFAYILACLVSSNVISMLGIILNLKIVSAKESLLASVLAGLILISYRIIIRFLMTNKIILKGNANPEKKRNLLIIGGGKAAKDIIKSIKETMREQYNIIGIIDDDMNKKNCSISGVGIIGSRKDIVKIAKEANVDLIFFSISKIDNKNKKEILKLCQDTGAKIRILPSTEDIINNKNMMENLRDVEIEDILGRDPIILDNYNISTLINKNVVMVTGGGGSIGSELCRQIIKFKPEELVIFDIYENNLYDIEMELRRNYPNVKISAIVGSVRDKKRLEKVFEEHKPYLVFHAAAHKHVPLMEVSPLEAIKNNIFGTYNVVNCADKYDVKRFVLISTDKAVNPTNIMGATKRMCEMIVQAKNKVSKTEYAAVRFGNVLGSNGSVVPLFKKQISAGGPVTVTHKEITRFFMTIPEAVQLILQAMTYAKGGEIFVLDMGEPVKIYDLAESLIKLSGLEPNVDIQIKVTGLRPGEKLYEELLMSEEGLQKTSHGKIFVAEPLNLTMEQIEEKLEILKPIINNENTSLKDIKHTVKQVVPTYKEENELIEEEV